jgi:hypothetical protein
LDEFLKQKLAFVDKNQAQLTCFQHSDVKSKLQTRSGILNHCDIAPISHYNFLTFLTFLECFK